MEDLWKIFDNINSWIKNCDSKTTILFGVITAFGLFFIDDIFIYKSIISNLFFILFLISYFASLFFLFRSIFPNVNIEYNSNIFFGSIAKKTYSNFDKSLSNNNYQISDDLKMQIHINSIVANKKFFNFKKGFWFLVFALVTYFFYRVTFAIIG